jgi:murein tripeptide amidase MpaA
MAAKEELSQAQIHEYHLQTQQSLAYVDHNREKPIIFVTSRVHPGESNASWMMKGLMDILLFPQTEEEKDIAQFLREEFEFYLVPMLNVDGVINGNYRCSLAACDLNRKWNNPSKILHPTIFHTKQLC